MAITIQDVNRWIETGKKKGASYLIVVCDTFSYEDYPVYVKPEEDLEKLKSKYSQNMQRIMEIIDLSKI